MLVTSLLHLYRNILAIITSFTCYSCKMPAFMLLHRYVKRLTSMSLFECNIILDFVYKVAIFFSFSLLILALKSMKSFIHFMWQVTNYHVVAKLATDKSGSQRCKVFPLSSYSRCYCDCTCFWQTITMQIIALL